MTNPMINPQPNYSGVTIQIANPAVYAGAGVNGGVNSGVQGGAAVNKGIAPYGYSETAYANGTNPVYGYPDSSLNSYTAPQPQVYATNPERQQGIPAYPPQYYLNNYNYQNNGIADDKKNIKSNNGVISPEDTAINQTDKQESDYNSNQNDDLEDLSKSKAVIDDLDSRAAKAEADKKNTTKKRVVALTDEYIKSLENYLNNPNEEIRLMASKEILTRLDEDKSRFDDAALNALLNKMLQDPSKLIRVASLSAFSSQLASGNDYTVQLLQNIQANPDADKEDVLQAADILLKMSAGTVMKDVPNQQAKSVDYRRIQKMVNEAVDKQQNSTKNLKEPDKE